MISQQPAGVFLFATGGEAYSVSSGATGNHTKRSSSSTRRVVSSDSTEAECTWAVFGHGRVDDAVHTRRVAPRMRVCASSRGVVCACFRCDAVAVLLHALAVLRFSASTDAVADLDTPPEPGGETMCFSAPQTAVDSFHQATFFGSTMLTKSQILEPASILM